MKVNVHRTVQNSTHYTKYIQKTKHEWRVYGGHHVCFT